MPDNRAARHGRRCGRLVRRLRTASNSGGPRAMCPGRRRESRVGSRRWATQMAPMLERARPSHRAGARRHRTENRCGPRESRPPDRPSTRDGRGRSVSPARARDAESPRESPPVSSPVRRRRQDTTRRRDPRHRRVRIQAARDRAYRVVGEFPPDPPPVATVARSIIPACRTSIGSRVPMRRACAIAMRAARCSPESRSASAS